MIVGLGFRAGSGKDTVANYLIDKYNFKKTSMAESIKEGIGRGVFGFTDEQLYGDLKEIVDEFWDSRLNIYEKVNEFGQKEVFPLSQEDVDEHGIELDLSFKRLPITPRLVLQLGGTEGGWKVFGKPLWIETVYRRISQSDHTDWVIPDVRYPSEAQAVKDWGGTLIRVDRVNAGVRLGVPAHSSETSMQGYDGWDFAVNNNGDLEGLFAKVDNIIKSKLKKTDR